MSVDWARLRAIVTPRRASAAARRRIWNEVDRRVAMRSAGPRSARLAIGLGVLASALVVAAVAPKRHRAAISVSPAPLPPRGVAAREPRFVGGVDRLPVPAWTARAASNCGSGLGDETVPSVDAFVDSIGLNVRASYYPDLFPMLADRMEALGVRHVVDMATTRVDLLATLADRGVRSQLWITPGTDVPALLRGAGGSVQALAFHNDFKAATATAWGEGMRAFIARVAGEMRADPAAASVALVGPTVAAADKRAALGDISEWVDFGASGSPSWATPPGDRALAELIQQHRELVGDETPLVVGQVLYGTGPGAAGLTETVQAKYLLRTYAENWRAGVARTYGPHIVDWTAAPRTYEQGLGILRHDGTPKAAYRALRAFIEVLHGDQGIVSPSGPLVVRIENEGPPVQHVLLRRPAGPFYLLLWLSLHSTDATIRTRARLTFDGAPRSLRLFWPLRGAEATTASAGARPDEVIVDVADELAVLQIATACPPPR